MSLNDGQVRKSQSFGLRIAIIAILISISEISSLPLRGENEPFKGFSYRLNKLVSVRNTLTQIEGTVNNFKKKLDISV